MRSDLYQNYLNILNSSEPNPSFAEIRELVTGERPARKPLLSPFFRYAFSAVVLLALVGLAGYYFASARSTQFAMTHPIVSPARTIVSNRALSPSSVQVLKGTQLGKGSSVVQASLHPSGEEPVVATTNDGTLSAVVPLQEPSRTRITSHTTDPSLHDDETLASPSMTRWGASLSIGTVFSRASMMVSPIDGAVGVYYNLSSHSTLVVELRQTIFPRAGGENRNTLRDTTVTLDGQSFRNSIGGASITSVQQLQRIASLDLGYRVVLLPDERFSPTAEILVGASTSGLLGSISAGIQYDLNSAASIDLSAREVQFYSRSSAPLGSFGMESRLSYDW